MQFVAAASYPFKCASKNSLVLFPLWSHWSHWIYGSSLSFLWPNKPRLCVPTLQAPDHLCCWIKEPQTLHRSPHLLNERPRWQKVWCLNLLLAPLFLGRTAWVVMGLMAFLSSYQHVATLLSRITHFSSVVFKLEQTKWFRPSLGVSGWALGNSITIHVQTHEVVIANHLPAYSKQQNNQQQNQCSWGEQPSYGIHKWTAACGAGDCVCLAGGLADPSTRTERNGKANRKGEQYVIPCTKAHSSHATKLTAREMLNACSSSFSSSFKAK